MAELGAGWSYKKSIVVDQTDDIGATNYQMKLTVHYGGADVDDVEATGIIHTPNASVTDFDDLRFTQSNGTTLIDYWIESKTDSDNAVVWVEIPMLDDAADTTIRMYYGNAGASAPDTSHNMGVATFPFFDDFTIDDDGSAYTITDKWAGYTALAAVSGGIMTMTSDAITWKYIYGKTAQANNVRVSMRALHSTEQSMLGMGIEDNTSYYNMVMSHYNAAGSFWWGRAADPNSTVLSTTAPEVNVYHRYDYWRLLTGTDTHGAFYDGSARGSVTTTVSTVNFTPRAGVITSATIIGICKIDWVFMSNYTYTEPTWGSFGAETSTGWANIAKINGIASANFSLVNGIAVADISKVNGVAV